MRKTMRLDKAVDMANQLIKQGRIDEALSIYNSCLRVAHTKEFRSNLIAKMHSLQIRPAAPVVKNDNFFSDNVVKPPEEKPKHRKKVTADIENNENEDFFSRLHPVDVSNAIPYSEMILSPADRQQITRIFAGPAYQVFQSGVGMIQSSLWVSTPGAGKTTLARTLARECGADLYDVDASVIKGKLFGQSAANIDALFKAIIEHMNDYLADPTKKPIMILIDEAETLIRGSNSNAQQDIIASIKKNLDGAHKTPFKAWIIFCLNSYKVDDAIVDRSKVMYFAPPDYDQRLEFFRQKLAALSNVANDIRYEELAEACKGCSFRNMEEIVSAADQYRLEYSNEDFKSIPVAEMLTNEVLKKAIQAHSRPISEKALKPYRDFCDHYSIPYRSVTT